MKKLSLKNIVFTIIIEGYNDILKQAVAIQRGDFDVLPEKISCNVYRSYLNDKQQKELPESENYMAVELTPIGMNCYKSYNQYLVILPNGKQDWISGTPIVRSIEQKEIPLVKQ